MRRPLPRLWLLVATAALALPPAIASEIAYQQRTQDGFDLYIVDDDGKNRRRLTDWPGEEGHPAFSPDGKSMAFHANRRGNFDLYVMDLPSQRSRRLTRSPADELEPTFAPDGSRIFYASDASGRFDIRAIPVAGGKSLAVAHALGRISLQPAVSPDGKLLAFSQSDLLHMRWRVVQKNLETGAERALSDFGHCRPSYDPRGGVVYCSERQSRTEHAIVRIDLKRGKAVEVVASLGMTFYDVAAGEAGLVYHAYPGRSAAKSIVYLLRWNSQEPVRIAGPGAMYPALRPHRPAAAPKDRRRRSPPKR